LAQNIKTNSRNWSDSLRAWFDQKQQIARGWIKNWEFQHSRLRYLLPVALVFFLVVLRVDMIPEIIRRLKVYAQMRVGHSADTNPQLAARLYSEFCRVLQKRGFIRRETQTSLEFAAAIDDSQVAPAVREFTEIYGRARFGAAPCNAVRLRELLAQVRVAARSR
jgi:Domain of unknown function (DUF4129)